jgi:hypothetical protein
MGQIRFVSPRDADICYNIATGRLDGQIDGHFVSMTAVSGGRSGSKTPGTLNYWLANNPFATRVKLTSRVPGGPLPLGIYAVRTHESTQNWLRLIPADSAMMFGRDGMAIHGRGPRGSDGCIVPMDFSNLVRLYSLVSAREKARNKPPVLLAVIAEGDLDSFLNRA